MTKSNTPKYDVLITSVMVRWQGDCIVHDEFKAYSLDDLVKKSPDEAVTCKSCTHCL